MFYRRFGHGNASMQVQHAIFVCFQRIKSFEDKQLHTEWKQRKFVHRLIPYSVSIFIIVAAVSCFFLHLSPSLQVQLFCLGLLLIFPVM